MLQKRRAGMASRSGLAGVLAAYWLSGPEREARARKKQQPRLSA